MARGEFKWTEIDALSDLSNINSSCQCFAYYDYDKTAPWHDDQGNSTGHSVIKNFKRLPSELKENAYYEKYKQEAIDQFSGHIRNFLQGASVGRESLLAYSGKIALIPVPPSRAKNDPDYDDRMLRVCKQAGEPLGLKVIEIAEAKENIVSSHGGGTRSPEVLLNNYRILLDKNNLFDIEYFFVVDDVLTTGCHFEAIKRIINRFYPDCTIIGLFLAYSV